MVIGNPYNFSIFADVIEEWNTSESIWRNGVLFFCIDGEIFTKHIATATLNSEIRPLKEKLTNLVVDARLWEMEKEKAFIEMCNMAFPIWSPDMENEGDICNDHRWFISPTILQGFGYHVYAVSNGKQIRILAAKLNYILEESTFDLEELEIIETFITNDELKKIIHGLDLLLERLI